MKNSAQFNPLDNEPEVLPPYRPNARNSDPETSHEAAEENRQVHFNRQCREVLKIVKKHPGRSSKHLAELAFADWLNGGDLASRPPDRYAIARRLSDLRELGKVENRYDKGKEIRCATGILWWPV